MTGSPGTGVSGLTLGSLTVSAGTVKTTGSTNVQNASKVGTLSITGSGKLDLNGPGMVLTGETVSHVTSLIVGAGGTGPGNQTWDQPGINSSFAAGDSVFRAVGILDNDNFIGGPVSTFEGVSVPAGSIIVKSTYAGDVNLDGKVDDTDATVFGIEYDGGATSGHVWMEGDLNYDGVIDDADATVFGINFGSIAPGPVFSGGVSAVPEPTSLAMFGIAAGALFVRRRRSR